MSRAAAGGSRRPWLALLGCAALAALLVWLIVHASLERSVVAGFRELAASRWGLATLVDVYAGAVVVSAWIWLRERSLAAWAAWTAALLLLGHVVSLAYLGRVLWRSGCGPGSASHGG